MIALILVVVSLAALSILAFFHYGRITKCLEHEENISSAMSEVLDSLKSATDSNNKVVAYKNVVRADALLRRLTSLYGVAALSEASETDVRRLQNTIISHIARCEAALGESHMFHFEKKDEESEGDDEGDDEPDDDGVSDDEPDDEDE